MAISLRVDGGGGYDYNFVEPPPDWLICNICHCPSKDPFLSGCCGNIFCKSCLEGAKKATTTTNACPTCRDEEFITFRHKQADRAVKALHVLCSNKEKGCKWQGELNDIINHLQNNDGCKFEEVTCTNECVERIQRQFLTSHVHNDCMRREVNCKYCHIAGEFQVIECEHREACPKFPIPCPNKCEADYIPREDIDDHRMTCPFEEVICPNVCGMRLQRRHLATHGNKDCTRRNVVCPFCQVMGEYQFIEGEHKELCPKFPVLCPNKCQADALIREDIEKHKTMCPLEDVTCPIDCGVTIKRQYLTTHVKMECPRRKVTCQYCHGTEEHQFIEGEHKEQCCKFPLACPNRCEIGSVPRENFEEHMKMCPLELIQCEYHIVGCEEKMVRKDQKKHNKEKLEEHLSFTAHQLSNTQRNIATSKFAAVNSREKQLVKFPPTGEVLDDTEPLLAGAPPNNIVQTTDKLMQRLQQTEKDLASFQELALSKMEKYKSDLSIKFEQMMENQTVEKLDVLKGDLDLKLQRAENEMKREMETAKDLLKKVETQNIKEEITRQIRQNDIKHTEEIRNAVVKETNRNKEELTQYFREIEAKHTEAINRANILVAPPQEEAVKMDQLVQNLQTIDAKHTKEMEVTRNSFDDKTKQITDDLQTIDAEHTEEMKVTRNTLADKAKQIKDDLQTIDAKHTEEMKVTRNTLADKAKQIKDDLQTIDAKHTEEMKVTRNILADKAKQIKDLTQCLQTIDDKHTDEMKSFKVISQKETKQIKEELYQHFEVKFMQELKVAQQEVARLSRDLAFVKDGMKKSKEDVEMMKQEVDKLTKYVNAELTGMKENLSHAQGGKARQAEEDAIQQKTEEEGKRIREDLTNATQKYFKQIQEEAKHELSNLVEQVIEKAKQTLNTVTMPPTEKVLNVAQVDPQTRQLQDDYQQLIATTDGLSQKLANMEKDLNTAKQQITMSYQNHTKAEEKNITVNAGNALAKVETEFQTKITEIETSAQKRIAELENKLDQKTQQIEILLKVTWNAQIISQAGNLSSGDQVAPVIVKMSEYTKSKADKKTWYSDPFYTHHEGYQIQACIHPDGKAHTSSCLTVRLYLMKGPYDEQLKWPLKGHCEVKLLNQISDSEHHLSNGKYYNDAGHPRVVGERIRSDTAIWYSNVFILDKGLYEVTATRQYLKDDCIFLQVKYKLD